MDSLKYYNQYFNIDPKYYAAVTAELISQGRVDWKSFYPHETFVKLLEKTYSVLAGKDTRSLWIEGAYGTGKSHAALTVKSLLDARDEDVEYYFNDYGLSKDLCQKFITVKNSGRLITIHRIGSSYIGNDQDLIIAVQESIINALKDAGITDYGEESLKEAALKWLEKKANHDYFNELISEMQYALLFGGNNIDKVIETLKGDNESLIAQVMRNVMKVAVDNGVTALQMDVQGLAKWIKSIIEKNNLNAILFVWDEFTEFFQNHPNNLTGFQTLAEISESSPFYFMIVTHKSEALFVNRETAKKIMDRFVPTIQIEMPENMAFRLMAQAMKKSEDPTLSAQWTEYAEELNENLQGVRHFIASSAKKGSTLGAKTVISEYELKGIVPVHPYAALLLKHLSVAFSSNQRSMFDFIISNDMDDHKGFKWFINNYGPEGKDNLLTIDMLWDFFYGKTQNGLNNDVRGILDSYNLLQKDKLSEDEQRVFKTILLLQAISLRVIGIDLLKPTTENVDLAFSGTDWGAGKAGSIAEVLCKKSILFKKPVGGGKNEYTVANSVGDQAKIEQLKEHYRDITKTANLVVSAQLTDAVTIPVALETRISKLGASTTSFNSVLAKAITDSKPERFSAVITYAINDKEASLVKDQILKVINNGRQDIIYIDTGVSPMGKDLYDQYIENMAFCEYYAKSDKARADGFQKQAEKCLTSWRDKIAAGPVILYSCKEKSGKHLPNMTALQAELKDFDYQIYNCGLEQFTVIDNMFKRSAAGQGAECGLTMKLSGTYKGSNPKTSLDNVFKGVWNVPKYWENSALQGLPIVKIKKKVEELIEKGFKSTAGKVSVLAIYEALESRPYGFMPINLTAFVLGYVLKEYATSDFSWSNGSTSEIMTVEKLKGAIANVINQKANPAKNFKEEYIVTMTDEHRAFLKCAAKAFRIPENSCGSIELARDQIRIKMNQLAFPIWCINYLLNKETVVSDKENLKTVINAFCGIVNTTKVGKASESDLATEIGALVLKTPTITDDLVKLLVSDKCKDGMLAYIRQYREGILSKLALRINDGGKYINEVKAKFSAGEANWVWKSDTVDAKIDDVILEYSIIEESNKVPFIHANSIKGVAIEWGKAINNIHMSYEALMGRVGDLETFLEELKYLKANSDVIIEQRKKKFYDALLVQRENFVEFYNNQVVYFKQIIDADTTELSEEEIYKFYNTLPFGQFMKNMSDYYKFIQNQVKDYLQKQVNKQLKELWKERTDTKDPKDWSYKYDTPITCMFDIKELNKIKEVFGTVINPTDEKKVKEAIEYLENADFFERLASDSERDRCFKEKIVGSYSVILNDVTDVRVYLKARSGVEPYYWQDNSIVTKCVDDLASARYKTDGYEKVSRYLESLDADELRRYLQKLIITNHKVGIEILTSKK